MDAIFNPVGDAPNVWHPADAREAYLLKRRLGRQAVYVAGGTLLRTEWEAGSRSVSPHWIDLQRAAGMGEVFMQTGGLCIGSQVTLGTCRKHPTLTSLYPLVGKAIRCTAAPSVRNVATLGGNVCSGVGDVLPSLLLYDAELVWQNEQGREAPLPLREWLELRAAGALDPDRILLAIRLPERADESGIRQASGGDDALPSLLRIEVYHKVGRREAFSPSLVTTAVSAEIDAAGCFRQVKIAAGGGKAMPARLGALEAWLVGSKADLSRLPDVYERVMEEYQPAGDIFAGESYRRKTAASLIAADLWQLLQQTASEGGGRYAEPIQQRNALEGPSGRPG
ncbi:carbon-monoxide dehydrogenase medium subunit [Paenibacillus rhizosphaerae]|uniref:Carbon-monoxide dehydrogenase medium subunit n=1 Tax=Paenibacillus rhizosphaerae TaxID=297318 RepID=A0A839TRG3_9BACL|nr:FAD binding domain-containing protein [Paenibacillus rhizosphaerae]MBB3127988.1 carbon-monoxide dehydrogenase medium subunit [Paenibacillus rhizosphaerae]